MFTRSADVAIVGAGAAGLCTAIFAARTRPGLTIALLDGAKRIGAKILMAGGGRCNVTNVRVTPDDYWGGSRNTIRRVLSRFDERETVAFFRELGLSLHAEENGKLFPDSNRAQSVLDALLAETQRRGVDILPDHRVVAIEPDPAGGFDLRIRSDRTGVEMLTALAPGRVVLASGGLSFPKTGSDGGGYELARRFGHRIVPTTPALAPLTLAGDFHAGLSGVAQEVEILAAAPGEKPERIRGALLWTHFGVSGPAAMNLSRVWHRAKLENREIRVVANLLPGATLEFCETRLREELAVRPTAQLRTVLHALTPPGGDTAVGAIASAARALPARVTDAMLQALGIAPSVTLAHLSRDERRRVLASLLERPLPISGSRGYGYAEATAGGVPLDEIDPRDLSSRKQSGLHLAGEVLDVDGRIGGFNFQWAWSSGFVAGCGVAERLVHEG